MILIKKVGVENMVSTKIEFNHNKIARIRDLDDLARLLFPGNKNQQRVFLAIFIELKYAQDQFLPVLKPLCEKYSFSPRMLETVRAKMRRMGIVDHVSRFNKKYGYREGWIFSGKFARSLKQLFELIHSFKGKKDAIQKKKDIDLFRYL